MSIADELQKLDELRRKGALDDEEFGRAKAALLASAGEAADGPTGHHLADQLASVRYQSELARIDGEWAIEREKYYITGRYGWRQLPTTGMGIASAAIGGVFGTIWTIMAFAITSSAPNAGPFPIVKVVFPLFGVAFTVGAIAWGIYCYNRAQGYQRALADYQSRRRAIQPAQLP